MYYKIILLMCFSFFFNDMGASTVIATIRGEIDATHLYFWLLDHLLLHNNSLKK